MKAEQWTDENGFTHTLRIDTRATATVVVERDRDARVSSKTICVMIGNSDEPRQLSQFEWHQFCGDVDRAISTACRYQGTQVHGRFYSLPNERWQNACWCIKVDDECSFVLDELRSTLSIAAREYRQRSIAWVEGTTSLVSPKEPSNA